MNRFNLDPIFTLNLRRIDKGYVSNLVTFEALDKIEERINAMIEYKEAKEVLNHIFWGKNGKA